MKTLKAEPTVIVRGFFKKRYYIILPNLQEFGVYELPVYPAEVVNKEKAKQNATTHRS